MGCHSNLSKTQPAIEIVEIKLPSHVGVKTRVGVSNTHDTHSSIGKQWWLSYWNNKISNQIWLMNIRSAFYDVFDVTQNVYRKPQHHLRWTDNRPDRSSRHEQSIDDERIIISSLKYEIWVWHRTQQIVCPSCISFRNLRKVDSSRWLVCLSIGTKQRLISS